jgi:hypothetical protein
MFFVNVFEKSEKFKLKTENKNTVLAKIATIFVKYVFRDLFLSLSLSLTSLEFYKGEKLIALV